MVTEKKLKSGSGDSDLDQQQWRRWTIKTCVMWIRIRGSMPLTNGSGSGWPKNMWIRWIQNTDKNSDLNVVPSSLVLGTPPKSMSMMPRLTSSLPCTVGNMLWIRLLYRLLSCTEKRALFTICFKALQYISEMRCCRTGNRNRRNRNFLP